MNVRTNDGTKYLFIALMLIFSLSLILNENSINENNTDLNLNKEISFSKGSISEQFPRYKLQYSSFFGGVEDIYSPYEYKWRCLDYR
jgi:hypothetical protein